MKNLIKDILDNIWVLVGLFIAWLVLEGTARTVVGVILVGTFIVWLATYKIRNYKENEKKES